MNKQIQRQWRGACEAGALPARRSTGRSAPASPATPCQQPGAAGEVQSWRVAGFGSRDLDAQERGWCAARAALHRSQRASLARLAMPAAGRARERCRAGAWRASVAEIWTRRTAGAARLERAPCRADPRARSEHLEAAREAVCRGAAAAAAACRNGALGGAAVAAERAESARKFDGVPAVGPDEGAAGSD
eukprot:CAMPEP_0196712770 /NCGR_PEP_ID=MMETSP1090-20130531/74875_1 /TAXON_ID=37098 /ORGANISM="Isochrysis sp, Strain CCMP1244" /LENGTH=189 /DNA_ID=CAMNT_0042052869 /DNA_START=284 /DNA_END=855 /DNA_ORIENTATION=-